VKNWFLINQFTPVGFEFSVGPGIDGIKAGFSHGRRSGISGQVFVAEDDRFGHDYFTSTPKACDV
jgi:hypothetical protein